MGTREFCAKYGVTQWTARRWAREGKVTARHMPPGSRTRVIILDPGWTQIDTPPSADPAEWLCVLRQCDVAMLLNVTPRWLRYLENRGKAHYRLVGGRKRYSLSEVRRLIAERTLGHSPRNRQEARLGMLRWAFGKLQQK
jgi:hypothetical protein